MKKKLSIALFACAFSVLFGGYTANAAANTVTEAPEIRISIDGKYGNYSAMPIVVNDSTLLPLRDLLINLGVQNDVEHIAWNDTDSSVTITKDSTKVYLKIGDNKATVNGNAVTLDAAPVVYNDKTYIPIRFVSKSFGKNVAWDEKNSLVVITSEGQSSVTAPVEKHDAFAYYVSNGALYRVMSDGTKGQKLLSSFEGVKLTPIGDYLYYMYDEKSTTLLRLPMDGSAKIATRFESDILYFTSEGNNIYYMNDKGAIYCAPSTAAKGSQGKLVTDMADTNYPQFSVINGKVYYNALKSGRTTWVATKNADGTGDIQWISEGAVPSSWCINTDNYTVYLMVNTTPKETQYSTNCMVLYSLPKIGGQAKAINPGNPLDFNAVFSGSWANGYYMFNQNIVLGSDGDFDYSTGTGYVMDMHGNTVQIHDSGIVEIVKTSPGKLVFVDGNGYADAVSIVDNTVVEKTVLPIANAWYIRNLMTDGNIRATMVFADSGAYTLKPDLTFEQMVGVEWDLCMYKKDVDGFFYVNAGDNGRLYHRDDVAGTNTKLSDDKVSRIVLISRP